MKTSEMFFRTESNKPHRTSSNMKYVQNVEIPSAFISITQLVTLFCGLDGADMEILTIPTLILTFLSSRNLLFRHHGLKK